MLLLSCMQLKRPGRPSDQNSSCDASHPPHTRCARIDCRRVPRCCRHFTHCAECRASCFVRILSPQLPGHTAGHGQRAAPLLPARGRHDRRRAARPRRHGGLHVRTCGSSTVRVLVACLLLLAGCCSPVHIGCEVGRYEEAGRTQGSSPCSCPRCCTPANGRMFLGAGAR
jgi:hypothetical protein